MINTLKRRPFLKKTLQSIGVGLLAPQWSMSNTTSISNSELRIGIVGLSVHSAAFTKILNNPDKKDVYKGCRVVSLYHPKGNPDVDFTAAQLASFQKDIEGSGVQVVNSMQEMLAMSDVVFIETNDGRPHYQEVLPVFEAKLPVFIDKPVAENLTGVLRIYEEARKRQIPIFTSSALRYLDSLQQLDKDKVVSAHTYSPASLEKSHTDLFWYGIHAVEPLFTAMGTGCQKVMHIQHDTTGDLVVGTWKDGRTGVIRGIRKGQNGFGGTIFMENKIISLEPFKGYDSLVQAIVRFCKTKQAPVPVEETIEIYAFMEAAMRSRQQSGIAVTLESVIKDALDRL